MKEENQKTRVFGKRTYLYIAFGAAALLLAVIVVIASIALANRGNGQLSVPPDIVTPDEGNGGNDKPVQGGGNQEVDGKTEEFFAPVANVSALHGYGFYHNQTLNNYYVHTGIDYSCQEGAEVFAAQSGTVESVESEDILVGGRVVIDHGNGVKTVYEFVQAKEGLKAGDKVNRGDTIATVAAATGNEYKDGSHLHFEVRENGKAVDPSKYYTAEEK